MEDGERLVPPWSPRAFPDPVEASHFMTTHVGSKTIVIEPIHAERHARGLYESFQSRGSDVYASIFRYLPTSAPANWTEFRAWIASVSGKRDPMMFAVVASDGSGSHLAQVLPARTQSASSPVPASVEVDALGMFSLLRTDSVNGVTEIGHIAYSPRLQRRIGTTDVLYVTLQYVFDHLRYRRFEWKCNSLNTPSRVAAERFGFLLEGVFRQHLVVKGRNRDTAWYSIVDKEYFGFLKRAYETWFRPENFDAEGKQRTSLGDVVRSARRRWEREAVPAVSEGAASKL